MQHRLSPESYTHTGKPPMDKAIKTYISVLKAEIQHLKSLLEPHDTGHIHTTIGTLQHRVKELEAQEK